MKGNVVERLRGPSGPRVLQFLGVLHFLLIPAQWLYFDAVGPGAPFDPRLLVSLLTAGVPALGIAYAGRRIERGDIDPERYPRIVGWTTGGLAGFLALNLVLIAAFPVDSLEGNVGWATGTALYGTVGGLAVGIVEARAIERARIAERETVRAERAEVEREWLDYLNSLLRHEVLNAANVVTGQAALLEDRLDDEDAIDRLRSIQRRSEDMTSVIEDVRVLIRATDDVDGFEPMDLTDVLETEVRALEDTFESVEVETSTPESVHVPADSLLPRIFSNLLANAVEHNESEVPRVWVSVENADDVAAVTVEDDGPGVPERERENLFQRRQRRHSEHGLGLYLVRTLVERYGGSVGLVETGSEGSTFRVELPRCRADEGGLPRRASSDVIQTLASDGGDRDRDRSEGD